MNAVLQKNILLHPTQWCTPAIIYAILFVASVVLLIITQNVSNENKISLIVVSTAFAVLIINAMLASCQMGFEWLAWLILLLLFIVSLLTPSMSSPFDI